LKSPGSALVQVTAPQSETGLKSTRGRYESLSDTSPAQHLQEFLNRCVDSAGIAHGHIGCGETGACFTRCCAV
jgi:hypothetical protein